MSEMTVQQALCILYSQSTLANPAEFLDRKEWNLPSRERDDSEHVKNHARFLNAVVSLLRTEPGQVLALSMELTGTQILIDVAGNKSSDVEATLTQTVKQVWTLMKGVAAALNMDEGMETLDQLVTYLLKKHWKIMQKRFRKRESMCRQFFEYIDSNTTQPSAPVQQYLVLARLIYKEMAKRLKGNDSPSDKDVSMLWGKAHKLRRRYRDTKSNDVTLDASLERLQSEVEKNADDAAVEEGRARGKRFTLVRYIEKLISPFDHVLNVYKAATKAPIADILRSEVPVDVRVHFHNAPEQKLTVSKPVLRRFLEDVALSHGGGEQDNNVTEVVKDITNAASDAVSTVQASHCECFLLHHLVNDRDSRQPLPYIAVSKLSCLQCALYFEGYEKFRTMKSPSLPPFAIRGCHHDVIVCLLPSQEIPSSALDPMDSFIGDYIIERVKGWLKIIIRDQIDSRNRRDSQSTAASAPSSDDDDEAMTLLLNEISESESGSPPSSAQHTL